MNKIKWLFLTILATLICCPISVFAQTDSYSPDNPNACFRNQSTWKHNYNLDCNRGGNVYLCQVPPGNEVVVDLTQDVYVYDRIFVGSAYYFSLGESVKPAKLTIRNRSGKKVTIHNRITPSTITASSSNSGSTITKKQDITNLFTFVSVLMNGTLVIEGDENSPIVIDGNSNDSNSTAFPVGFIENQGTLDFKHVTIQNVKFSSASTSLGNCSLFKICPWDTKGVGQKLGTMTFDHCTIQNITSPASYGAVMLNYLNMGANAVNTRSSNKITFTNCLIQNVTQGGAATQDATGGAQGDKQANTAGIIRFRGGWIGDLYMKNTVIRNNTSTYTCAGVYWNAVGRKEDHPVFTIDGCEFYGNKVTNASCDGGAMVLQGEFKFEGGQTKVYNNSAGHLGGGIAVMGYTGTDAIEQTTITMNINDKLEVYNNQSELGGGMSFYCSDYCNLTDGSQVVINVDGCNIHDNTANRLGGGMHIQWKSNYVNDHNIGLTVNLNQGTFANNKVTGTTVGNYGGGGLSVMGGKVTSTSGARCTFSGNTSGYLGGAIRFDDGANVQLGTVDITNCSAAYGGGITVEGSGTTMTMSDVEISNCSATETGGGISLYESASATINSANITGCSANGGGAVSAYGGSTLIINQATINGNTATYDESDTADVDTDTHYNGCGGALLANASTITINDGTISNCTARDGGGVYLNLGSKYGMTKGVISDNNASRRGGGVYSSGIGFELKDGLITRNTAGEFGGGIFYNQGSYSNQAGYTIAGGTVSYNKAYGGGGIYVNAYDKGTITIKNTLVEYNEAYIGGGTLIYHAPTIFSNAYIRYNKAIGVDGKKPATMYNINHCVGGHPNTDAPETTLSGIGGGIYGCVFANMSFNTAVGEGFGIYGNTADYGADDIYLSNQNTTLNLPAISSLGLSGYNVPVNKSQLFWAEDYIDNDPNYEQGTNGLKGTGEANVRYRTSLENMSTSLSKTMVNAGTYNNQYLMLAVGFAMAKVTLKKNGLQKGETCVFKIYANDGDQYKQSTTGSGVRPVSPLNCYMTVMMVGGGTGVDTKTLILPAGHWVAQESPYWAWTYDKVDDTDPAVNTIEDPLLIGLEVKTDNNTVFEFTNTKRTNITTPHAEGVKQNSLQKQ